MSGAGAAIGSSVVKVPLAVCIRSVQAGRYPNAFAAAQSIVDTAGVRSLFTVSRCRFCLRPRSSGEALAHCASRLRCRCGAKVGIQCIRLFVSSTMTRLTQGFLPTLLEDVPDMAVKFAVYESLRSLHQRAFHGRPATILEDLVIGGTAGAAAAAATTPLDVVKTVSTAACAPNKAVTALPFRAFGPCTAGPCISVCSMGGWPHYSETSSQ